jgi:hypothetical protein
VTFDELKNSKTFQKFSKQIMVYKRGALRSLKIQNPKMLMHKLWQTNHVTYDELKNSKTFQNSSIL